MPYLESNIPAGTAESDLVVLHYTNNQWVTESNCTVDTINNKITCIVTELSPFGIGSRSATQTSQDQNIIYVDLTPPQFEKSQNIIVDATTSNGATVTYETPKAFDNEGITATPVCAPESGSFFPIGTTPVTCTVKDNAGIQGATIFLVTVKSLVAAPVEIPNDVSVKIGKSDYNTKEAIFVSGIATPITEDNVSIHVQDQTNNLVLVEQITPESSGIYTGIIFPNSLWSASGNYTMSATYGDAIDSVPFTFEYIQTEIDNSNIPTGITLNTNSTGYLLGDVISVTSQLTGGTSGQSIIIGVVDESGDNVVLQSLNTDDSGSVSLNFKAQDSWLPGTYNVTATDGSPLWDYTTSKLIQLVRPLPEITISPTVTTTEAGDTIDSYKAGEIGYFSSALGSGSTSDVLVTVNVLDSEGATLGVAFFKSIVGKGDSEIILGFKIPEDAADGTAKIYVNTYTDWIDQGGIAISSELVSEVNIEGVISVENISDDGTVLVTPKSGSSVPGCEQSIQGCFLPNPTIIDVGDTVSFSNTDTVAHTFTSGSPSNGPNGIFDSSLLMSGDNYEFTFENAGQYDYFDMVHPWMTGTIVVQNEGSSVTLPENIIPKFSEISDITQSASSVEGNLVSYQLPIATSGITTLSPTCTPAPGSLFPIGSTQVTCTATNAVGNTGMTSFMVTINPITQVADQTLTVKVGKDSYNNLEPIFVTGSVGTVTGDPVNLEVYNQLNNLISIEQTSPKETGVYNTIITSNDLWSNSGEYDIIAKYGDASTQDTFEFVVVEVEESISEKIPTALFVSTDKSAYVLGDNILIDMKLVDAGAGEPILLEIRDSNNEQVLLQSLNTDSDGVADITYHLESVQESGVYSVIVKSKSADWDFITTETFVTVPQIPDITIGDVVPTLQDGTLVDSFESGDIGYFKTPVISNSTSNVLISVNIFDVQNTPLGLAHFNSKVVDETFDIVLGLQIPQDATTGLATVYINTYTDWPNEGGVPILQEQVSFIEISPASTTDLILSTNSTSTNSTSTNSTSTNSTEVNE
jgi:plastocyanin/5-hydroxyisourate hydrolase-like protein (transthyretin family)